MPFDIPIKVDPGDAAAKAKAVEDALHKTEDRGIAAGKAMLGLSGAFAKLGQAMAQERAALERTHTAHDRLTRSNQPLVQGFARLAQAMERERAAAQRTHEVHQRLSAQSAPLVQGFGRVAEAMRRENDVLERIHGPVLQYTRDLQTLDSLLSRNRISTSQYAAEVRKLNHDIDGAPKQVAKGPSLLAGARGLAATAGIGFGVHEVGQMVDEFQNLQNRLRFLAGGDMQKVNELFGELTGVANRTRQSLGGTTEAFVKISMATKQMGLSQSEALSFTERLNEAITLSGATTAGAQAAMLQLSQGLSAGALRGEEFNSVLENAPVVIQTIADNLKMTTGQLRKFAFDGKLSADVIIDAFRKAGTSLDKDFGNTVPTMSQNWTVFKNNLTATVGELDKSLGVTKQLGDGMQALGAAVAGVLHPLKDLKDGLDALPGGDLLTMGGLEGLGELSRLDNWTDKLKRADEITAKYAHRNYELMISLAQGADAVKKWHLEQTEMNLRLTAGDAAADAFHRSIQEVNAVTAAGAPIMERMTGAVGGLLEALSNDGFYALVKLRDPWFVKPEIAEKVAKTAKATRDLGEAMFDLDRARLGVTFDQIARAGSAAQEDTGELIDVLGDLKKQFGDVGKARQKELATAEKNRVDALTDAWKREIEANKQAADAAQEIGAAFRPATTALENFLKTGEFSADAFLDTLDDIAIKLLEMAALQAIGPGGGAGSGFLRGILGGKTGFDYTVNSDPLQRPGFATGGDFRIPGPGGTDSRLIQFWGTPGETVHVRTPEQQRATGRAETAPTKVSVSVIAQNNERDVIAAGGTYGAGKVFVQNQRKYGRRTR